MKDIEISWNETDIAEYPFSTKFNDEIYFIRINDFPEEEMYTLLKGDIALFNFNDWPENWKKPDYRRKSK